MLSLFVPDIRLDSIYELTGEMLSCLGIKVLITDLDNTLAEYETPLPTPEVTEWIHKLRSVGIKVAVVSNNNKLRVEKYCATLGVDYYWKSGKPRVKTMKKAMKKLGGAKETTALVGDKTVTDILGAKLCGILAIKVTSLSKRRSGEK